MPKFNLTINELLDQMGDLPSLPEIFHKAINIIENPTSNMKELADCDQTRSGDEQPDFALGKFRLLCIKQEYHID